MSIREELEAAVEELEGENTSTSESTESTETLADVGDSQPTESEVLASDSQVSTSPAEQQKEASAEALPPLIAPNHWTKDGKDGFNALPRNIQEVLLKREKDRERGIQKQLEEINKSKKAYGELETFISPHVERWNLNGVQPTQVIQQLVAAQDFLNRNPVEGLKWLAKSYGLDLAQLAQASVSNGQQASNQPDPQIYHEIQTLRAQLQAIQEEKTNGAINSTISEIESFATEMGANGVPLRPYFEDVAEEIGKWIQIVRQSKPDAANRDVLNEAYDRAVWANPDTRNAMLQMQAKAKELELRKKSNAAANAGKSISGSPGNTSGSVASGSLREQLEAAWEESHI